jgi:DNA (cytosine-5)-methyltransferase 1
MLPVISTGAVANRYIIRRLTPTECQRLQGFPDGWDIPEAADTKKYKMWGNGMAKPCVKYILSNIDEEENPHG